MKASLNQETSINNSTHSTHKTDNLDSPTPPRYLTNMSEEILTARIVYVFCKGSKTSIHMKVKRKTWKSKDAAVEKYDYPKLQKAYIYNY